MASVIWTFKVWITDVDGEKQNGSWNTKVKAYKQNV
jgi:hypothetical protein